MAEMAKPNPVSEAQRAKNKLAARNAAPVPTAKQREAMEEQRKQNRLARMAPESRVLMEIREELAKSRAAMEAEKMKEASHGR